MTSNQQQPIQPIAELSATSQMAPICVCCKHFRRDKPGLTCDAYPDGSGIPDAILTLQVDHHLPYAGDHGIQFAPDDAQAEADAQLLLRMAGLASMHPLEEAGE